MNWQKYLGLAIILLAIYSAGMGTGAALWYGHVQTQIVTIVEQAKTASDTVLPALAKKQITIAEQKPIIQEGLTHVSDNPLCNLSRGDVGVLNLARTGQPDAAAITHEEKQTPSSLTQRAEAKAHAECATQYRELADVHDALIDWLVLSGRKK
jgi:hypothetical protein